jgi:hypothetical protein
VMSNVAALLGISIIRQAPGRLLICRRKIIFGFGREQMRVYALQSWAGS